MTNDKPKTTPVWPRTDDVPDHWRDGMAADQDLFNIKKRVLKRKGGPAPIDAPDLGKPEDDLT